MTEEDYQKLEEYLKKLEYATRQMVDDAVREVFSEVAVEHYSVPMACRCGESVGQLTEYGRNNFLIIAGMDKPNCVLFDIEQFDEDAFVDIPKRKYNSIDDIKLAISILDSKIKEHNLSRENIIVYVYWDECSAPLWMSGQKDGGIKPSLSGVFEELVYPPEYDHCVGPEIGIMLGEGL